jgi:hypothetical protein
MGVVISLATVMMFVAEASAMPIVSGYEGLFFENAEVWLDKDGSQTISVGDTFWGVTNTQNIKGPTDASGQIGPNIWFQAAGTPKEITGYFATDVVATIPGGGGTTDLIIFGLPASDPNGKLAAGQLVQIYEDTVNNFNNSSQALGLATATDGTPLWSLGMGPSTDGDSSGGYWYSLAPIILPLVSNVGESYAGLNYILPGGSSFMAIDDPNEVFANQLVEFWLNSEIFRVSAAGGGFVNPFADGGVFHFGSNDPAVFHPVPEPATMLLLGSGLLGLAGLGRKKFFKKG